MESTNDQQGELYEVFIQSKPGQSFKHAGSVHAFDKNMALQNARDTYTRRNEGTGIWVVPSKEITALSLEEQAYFVEPSTDKIYRHPTFYNLPEGVKNM
ncbi:MAG: 1,2-phenylacetyl-CoA epoxidase subunit B [Bacteroidetes bacterium]|nr:MAG: 1,2-phenylacetyl-CoA epoxidase subunit B [Bacteroidota bacterium]